MRESRAYEQIVKVSSLPAAGSSYDGALAYQSSDGHLYWCNGSAWIDVSHRIRTYTWVIGSPAVGGVLGPRLKAGQTCLRLDSHVAASTSVTFNIEERSTLGSAGTNIVASDQVATTTGASTTSFSNAGLAADNWLHVDISAVSGTPGQVSMTLAVVDA